MNNQNSTDFFNDNYLLEKTTNAASLSLDQNNTLSPEKPKRWRKKAVKYVKVTGRR